MKGYTLLWCGFCDNLMATAFLNCIYLLFVCVARLVYKQTLTTTTNTELISTCIYHAPEFQNVTVVTTERSVHRRVEKGVREVHVTPLTALVSVYRDGNLQHAT